MKQHLLKNLFVCLLSFVSMTVSAHDCEVDGIYYYLNKTSQTANVTYKMGGDYGDYSGAVHIPEEFVYDGTTYRVTGIGQFAFNLCSGLTELTIPNSVTGIGYCAFQACGGLKKLTLSNELTSIGMMAFYLCSGLTELTIPNSVTKIDDRAFLNCFRLTEVTIPSNVISIGENPFAGCGDLERIVVEAGNPYYDSREGCNAIIRTDENELISGCKNTHIPNNITSIGFWAFMGCSNLTELAIPNSVTSIDVRAFQNCSGLKELTIPNSVTSIGEALLFGCSDLEKIVVEAGNPCYDSREDCNAIIHTGENILIGGCKNTHIPNSVTTIGNYAFYECI